MRLYRGPYRYGRETPELPFGFRELFTRAIIAIQRKSRKALSYDFKDDTAAGILTKGLESGKPFFAARFGTGELEAAMRGRDITTPVCYTRKIFQILTGASGPFWWDNSIKAGLNNNAGFFPPTNEAMQRFSNLVVQDARQIDILGAYSDMSRPFLRSVLPQAKLIPIFDLEPFWHAPHWTRCLTGKKVLVIHSMPDTIKTQYGKRASLFGNPDILPAFDLITYRSVNSAMGLKTAFDNWFDALEKMKDDISKTDFDIALLGCGAYGMNLGAFIKRDLGKTALHLGGMLQLLFGIKGKRWESDPKYSSLYTDSWTRPLSHEVPSANVRIENGCYW